MISAKWALVLLLLVCGVAVLIKRGSPSEPQVHLYSTPSRPCPLEQTCPFKRRVASPPLRSSMKRLRQLPLNDFQEVAAFTRQQPVIMSHPPLRDVGRYSTGESHIGHGLSFARQGSPMITLIEQPQAVPQLPMMRASLAQDQSFVSDLLSEMSQAGIGFVITDKRGHGSGDMSELSGVSYGEVSQKREIPEKQELRFVFADEPSVSFREV